MKTKSLVIIFILLLPLASAATVFLTKEKSRSAVSGQTDAVEEQAELVANEPKKAVPAVPQKTVAPEKTETQEVVDAPVEKKIKAVMIVSGAEYEVEIADGSSVYDLMDQLKRENKIDFSGRNYAGMGFFVEEINGAKNDAAGKNWIYYVNGRPAPVGISNYLIKANDIIKWKYSPR